MWSLRTSSEVGARRRRVGAAVLGAALAAAVLTLAAGGVAAQTDSRIGTVKTVKGDARIIEAGGGQKAAVGSAVRQDDVIETGKDGALGLTFIDDTTLSLGPNSRITLSKVVFDPDKGHFAFLANLARGTFMFISGGIARLSPQSVRITTPVSTIGIRGTRFLVKVD